MSDQSVPLPVAAVSDDSPVNPEEALFLWRAVLFSPVTLSPPFDEVAKMAVKALRDGVRTAWTDAHSELFSEVVGCLTECRTADFEKDGIKNGCFLCAKLRNRCDLAASCGLVELCTEVMMMNTVSWSCVQLAIAFLSRINEWGSTSTGTCVRAYTRCEAADSERTVVFYRFTWVEQSLNISFCFVFFQPGEEEPRVGAAKAALFEATSVLMQNADYCIRMATVLQLRSLVDRPNEAICSAEDAAACVAPIAAATLGDENESVRRHAAELTQVIVDRYPDVSFARVTPRSFANAISGALRFARHQPGLFEVLTRLAAAAPESLTRGMYDTAIGRLKEAQDNEYSQETISAAFFEVFLTARLAGDSCKDDFIEKFMVLLHSRAQLKTDYTAEPEDCYACYDAKAAVVMKKGCDQIDCGECGCTRAHFCASCSARIFLAFPNPYQITCQMCRRVICLDDVRLLKSSDCDAEKNTR